MSVPRGPRGGARRWLGTGLAVAGCTLVILGLGTARAPATTAPTQLLATLHVTGDGPAQSTAELNPPDVPAAVTLTPGASYRLVITGSIDTTFPYQGGSRTVAEDALYCYSHGGTPVPPASSPETCTVAAPGPGVTKELLLRYSGLAEGPPIAGALNDAHLYDVTFTYPVTNPKASLVAQWSKGLDSTYAGEIVIKLYGPSTGPPPKPHPVPPGGGDTGGSFGSLSPPSTLCSAGVTASVRSDSRAGSVGAAARSGAAFCAAQRTLTPAEKGQARAQLKEDVTATAIVCGLFVAGIAGNAKIFGLSNSELEAANFFSGLSSDLLREDLCTGALLVMADTLDQVHDPPDSSFLSVARAQPPLQNAPGGQCPGRVSSAACATLLAAKKRYADAVATTASIGGALAVTTNRFAGALKAKSVPGAFLQNAVRKVYAGAFAGALGAQQAAGANLAGQLRAANLDAAFSASAIKRVASATAGVVISNGLLRLLVRDGVVANAAQARGPLTRALGGVSAGADLAAALSAPLSSSAFAQHYRSITLRELAAIVRALAAQKALTSAASQTLTADITVAQKACANASVRATAMQKFSADAGAQAYAAAANFLQFGAQPLSAPTVSASACA